MLGTRLKQYRKKKGWSLNNLANIIKVSQGSLSDIERGKTKPAADTLTALCKKTDIDIIWLLTGKKDDEQIARLLPNPELRRLYYAFDDGNLSEEKKEYILDHLRVLNDATEKNLFKRKKTGK